MRIEKGKYYLCTQTVVMKSSGEKDGKPCFTKGVIYKSPFDRFLIDSFGDNHEVDSEGWHLDKFAPYNINYAKNDPINPDHYKRGNEYEPIKIIQHYNLSFELGNVIKYVLRCDSKGNREEDLKKAIRYLQYELDKIK